ncbi:hypothetical protein ACFQ0B_48740 [Nonomuraea thailandensis]
MRRHPPGPLDLARVAGTVLDSRRDQARRAASASPRSSRPR